MHTFVQNASWTRYHAISEIISIDRAKKKERGFGYASRVTLRGGEVIHLDSHDVDRIIDPIAAVIPAIHGYSVIRTGNCLDGSPYTVREAVLAWQVLASGDLRPVTIRGANDGELHDVAVEQPMGAIWSPMDDCIYRDFDEFRAEELKRHQREDGGTELTEAQAENLRAAGILEGKA